jgi:hypothetical protein
MMTPKIPVRAMQTPQAKTEVAMAEPGGVALIALKKLTEGATSPRMAPIIDAGARHHIDILKYGEQDCPCCQ